MNVLSIRKEITTLYYAYQHPNVGELPRMIILFTVGYALSPIDLIPDFIPIPGYLDDLLIIPALLSLSIKLIPQGVLGRIQKKGRTGTVPTQKNWFFAAIFIVIWILLLTAVISAIIETIGRYLQ